MDLLHLSDLALMTCLHIPLDVLPHPLSPKSIFQMSQHQEDSFVSEVVVRLLDKSIVLCFVRDSLMPPLLLLLPQPVILEEELRHLGHKTLPLLLIDLLRLLLFPGDTT